MAFRYGVGMVRFDKPCFAVKGAVEYFREHLSVGDYLTQEGQAQMTWFGGGAEQLGLNGPCDLAHFESLARGYHPLTGQKLMARDKGGKRRVCYFGQVSPPKDVSLLHLVGGDQRIGGWWQEAVVDTLREIEAVTATRVRRGGGNGDRLTGNMVASIVTHDASRALDPQLHTHVCIMNLTYDAAEQRWKGVQPFGYYRHQGFFREVCYNKLAARMLAAGYELETVRGIGFNVKGVPAELRQRFSKRRGMILRQADRVGASSQNALQSIAADSRAAKSHATAADLRAGWLREAGAELHPLREAVARATGMPVPRVAVTPAQAVASAEAHVFERRSVVTDRVLLREALVAGRGDVTVDELRQAIAAREHAGGLIRAGEEIASRDNLEAEREFTGWANTQLDACGRMGDVPPGLRLEGDQAKAVAGVLGSASRIVILQGDAGTGKTACLKPIVAGIERAGGRVFGCAPSAGAADVLRQDLTSQADTLQQLLVNESLQQAARGRVLLVDEAGLMSARQMRDLCRLAARNDNRVLLVGDVKQHSSVEAGDALRCLQEFARVPVFHLTEIRRQQDPAYRQAVAMLAQRNAAGAFKAFDRLGAVRELPDDDRLWQAAAGDYVRTVRSGKSCLAISPVWSEIHRFTDAVREQLKLAKLVAREERTVTTVQSLQWTAEERRRVQNYQPGDVLTFHRPSEGFQKGEAVVAVRREGGSLVVRAPAGRERLLDPRTTGGFDVGLARDIELAVGDRLLIRANLPASGLRNGDLVEVAEFGEDGGITCRDGRLLPASFRDFTHGYATTSHAAQGKTVDRGILLMASEGIDAGNLKQAYVSNSRFRESQMIYTSDKEGALEAMRRPADRKLALEMVGDQPPPEESPRPSLRERFGFRPKVPAIAA
ncbi:MAG: MobF family relaxase [Verrucomicrobiota bacterium]